MKHLTYILIVLFSIEANAQVENIDINFYPAFIDSSLIKFSDYSIELTIDRLDYKEVRKINNSDYEKIISGIEKYFNSQKQTEVTALGKILDEIPGEDGVTVAFSVTEENSAFKFQFWSPKENSESCNLSSLIFTVCEKYLKKETSLNYLTCLSEYFPFKTNYPSDNCEKFSTEIYFICDTMPKFPGGKNALEKYLEISLKESNLSTNYKDESIVYVSFVMLKSGKLVDIKLANMEKKQRISQKTEEKIIKIIESMPKWEPGILNGKVVNAQYFIPIKTNK